MPSSKSFLASLLAAAPVVFGAVVDDSECDCYVINGTKPTYYAKHMFVDFRSLSQYAKVPPLLDTLAANADADASSAFFAWDSEWGQTWSVQSWSSDDEAIPMQNSANNVYIQANDDDHPASETFMTMRTARGDGFQSAAEIESMDTYHYASMRMFARTIGSAGACTAMFTYRDGGSLAKVQEADIEVLTKDADNVIHYTNQPSYTDEGDDVAGASETVTLPDGLKWSNWGTHRLDWTKDEVLWYLDGKLTARNDFQVPKDAATLTFNAWSNGGEWTGEMAEGGVAYQQIQWIEILHGEADEASCARVCSVDETSELGKPVRVGGGSARCAAKRRVRV